MEKSLYDLNIPDERIVEYIKKNKVFTLSTSKGNIPYCAICFYAYNHQQSALIFKSENNTRHVREMLKNPEVAGSIVDPEKEVGRVRGIQFTGTVFEPYDYWIEESKKTYHKAFPYARLSNAPIWVLTLDYIKMTDNRLGFGKKLIWEREKVKG